ncbi:MAG: DNA polymerase III subunit delta [Pseudomonadota bacterium]
MVAIKASLVPKTVADPGTAYSAFLIYGPDAGLVSENARTIALHLAAHSGPEPGEIIRLDEDDLAADPDRLSVELRTVSMFGDAKIVRLRMGARTNPDQLADFLEGPAIEGRLVVEAGELKKTAKLRKLFEGAGSAAALPCYPDGARSLEGLVDEVMRDNGITITPDAKSVLVGMLGADRALSRNELEKLALYATETKRVEVEDVREVVGDASELALDAIVRAAFAGRADQALGEYDRAVASGQTAQGVLLALQRHVLRLLRFRLARDAGRSADQAMRMVRPPVFGADRDIFIRQANTWSSRRLNALREGVARAVLLGRTEPTLEAAEAGRILTSIAQASSR